METAQCIRLRELETVEVDRGGVADAAGMPVDDLASDLRGIVRLEPAWQHGKVRFRARQSIGAVQVGSLRVEVLPRLAAREAAAFIRYALGGKVDPTLRASFPMGPSPGLDELVAHVLADEAERIWQVGLSRLYAQRHEPLRVLRGRPDFLASFPWDRKRQDSVVCSYHLLTCDNLDNRLMRAGLEHACLLEITPRTRARLLAHRRRWTYAAAAMHPEAEHFAEARRRYTRLSEHYGLAHSLSEIILARKRPATLFQSGSVVSSGMVLSMPLLFEKFVERLMRDELVADDVRVESQRPDQRALLDGEGRLYSRVRPDLVLYREDKPILVVDAKYKEYWPAAPSSLEPAHRVQNADLYQLFFYALRLQLRYGLEAPPAACIVSPLPAENERGGRHEIGSR